MQRIDRPSSNHDDRGGAAIDMLVLHYTGMKTAEEALARLCDPAAKVSAHYTIDRDGTIYAHVSEAERAWHAGVSYWAGERNVNARSIGIEIVNDGSGKTPFTEAQYKSLTQLVGYLKQEYKVPMDNIVGHKDVAVPKGRKTDPASNFDWTRLRKGIS